MTSQLALCQLSVYVCYAIPTVSKNFCIFEHFCEAKALSIIRAF